MKRFTDPWIVAGIIISILVGVIMVLIGKDEVDSLIVGLLLTILTLMLDIFRSFKSHEQLLMENFSLSDDPWLYSKVKDIFSSWKRIKSEVRDDFFLDKSRDVIEQCTRTISDLSKGRITLNMVDEILVASDLIKRSKKYARAVSHISFDNWWRSEIGQQYLKDNIAMIEKDINIIRIFIIPRSKIEDMRDLIQKQHEEKIQVWIAIEEDQAIELLESYLIVDDKIVTKSQFTLGGRSRGAYVTADENEVRNTIQNFNWLLRNSREAEKVYQFKIIGS
jgi:hypothetical protein